MITKTAEDSADLWIERTGSDKPQFRLFCFHYAGGNAAMFRDWAHELGSNIEVCGIRLPGRERRYFEPAIRRSEQVVESLLPILRPFLDLPFAIFGYSMGALLAYEVALAIRAAMGIEPRGLLVSAHRAPNLPMRRREWYGLPRDALIAELKALNGTPAEVFENEELLELMLPMLRSDLELVETYRNDGRTVLSCPIVAMGGANDSSISPQEIAGWAVMTTGSFKSIMFDGDHFFINHARTDVLQAIRRELSAFGFGSGIAA